MFLKTCSLFFFLTSFVVSADAFLYRQNSNNTSDECILEETGTTSLCIELLNCDYAKELLRQNKFPQTCGFNGKEPKVCCPIGAKTRLNEQPGDFAKRACEKIKNGLSDKNENLRLLREIRDPPNVDIISGGTLAEEKEFKHMALLGFNDSGRVSWQCGGSLISQQYVLTAAHCLYANGLGPVKYVRLGELNYDLITDPTIYQDFNITQIYKHPNFTYPSTYNDIALLQLDQPAIFDEFVRPACLYTDKYINTTDDAQLVIAGWGKTEAIADEGSPHLRKANVEVFAHEVCSEVYAKDRRKLSEGIVDDLQLCAGSYVDQSNTCQGDSGGPLELDEKLSGGTLSTIVGVTSFGKACGFVGIPGVYTRVSSYIEWIEDVVWKNNILLSK